MERNGNLVKGAYSVVAVLAISGSFCMPAFTESVQEIVAKADRLLTGDRVYSESEMTVYRSGESRDPMRIESYSMEREGADCSLMVYRQPARMRGTAYLMIDDDLWVKFASTGRTRKMSSSAKKNSAAGSDFSYSDMGEGSQGISEKYTVAMQNPDAALSGRSCYEIVFVPKPGEDGTYEKLVAYITKDEYHYLRLDYYEDGAQIKTLTLSDYRPAGGREYPYTIVMESHTKPTRTEIVTLAIEFDSPRVRESMFSTAYLNRIK